MGGPGGIRVTRRTALMSAVATLFAALFICLGPGTGPAEADSHHMNGISVAPQHHIEKRFGCPYDKGTCRFIPHLSPAVLTVPPPAAPLSAGFSQPRPGSPPAAGRPARSGPFARPPDLHVLQVLRT